MKWGLPHSTLGSGVHPCRRDLGGSKRTERPDRGAPLLLRLSGGLHCGEDLGRRVGDRAQPDAGRVEHRIRDRGGNDRGSGLARTPRLFVWPVNELHHDVGHLREREDWIARPVEAGDLRAVELQLLYQRPAHGLDHIALDLALQAVGVDDLAAVVGDVELGNGDTATRAVNFDLGDRTNIGAHQLVFCVADAASLYDVASGAFFWRGTFLPLGQRSQPLEHLDRALVRGGQTFQTEFQRVHARRRRQLVDEAFVGVSILHASGSPDPGWTQRRRLQAATDRSYVREFVRDR